MGKLKSSLSISDRDKKILMVLLAIAMLAASYFFCCQKFLDQADKYNKETKTLKAKHADLLQKQNNRDFYISETNRCNDVSEAILSEYANDVTYDGNLMNIHTMEGSTDTWISAVSQTEKEVVYTFGNIASTNPLSSGGVVYTTDMQGVKSTMTMTYETSYDNWKKMMSYINGFYSKNTIDSINMTYSPDIDIVKGSLVVTSYAITGAERPYEHPEIDLPTSTINIFNSASFNPGDFEVAVGNGEYILSDYDYYMTLNAANGSNASIIMGKKDDISKKSILSSRNNEVENVSIKFSGSNGNYTVSYKIGNATFPAVDYDKGESFIAGASLEFLVMSSERLADTDKGGANLTIINETDMPLNVKVCNDDKDDPRVSIVSKTGDVVIYN